MDIFFLLLFGHALGDYALQTEYMCTNKNPKNNPENWYFVLIAHSVIHGGLVGFFTGSLVLALAETVAHFLIDLGKMKGKFGFRTDELLHIGAKGLWVILMTQGLA